MSLLKPTVLPEIYMLVCIIRLEALEEKHVQFR